MSKIRSYLGLIRFSHTLFAMPFALSSAAIAWHRTTFRWWDLVGIVLCMVTARAFAMGFNRFADRRIDAENPRTASRHLPSGQLSSTGVILFTSLSGLLFVLVTGIFALRDDANWWPLILSVPVLLFVAFYSLTKRFTSLAHLWLGASLMLAPVSAWIAIVGISEMTTPLILGLSVLLWVTGFDVIYACQDEEFDRKTGLHSIPARLGVRNSLRLAFALHLAMLVVLALAAVQVPEFGWIFSLGLAVIAVVLLSQHALVKSNDLGRVNLAFFHVNSVVSLGLLAMILAELAWDV